MYMRLSFVSLCGQVHKAEGYLAALRVEGQAIDEASEHSSGANHVPPRLIFGVFMFSAAPTGKM